jgi:LysM repeat protein
MRISTPSLPARGAALRRAFLLLALALTAGARAEETYTVQSGDTLGGIAAQFKVTARALQQHNHLSNPDRLAVGQTLAIPPGPDVPIRYVIQPGDTLSDIARTHGVTMSTLIELNELASPDQLRVNQELLIPGSARGRHPDLPADVRRALDAIRVRRGWTHIVLHHTATPNGNVKDMDRYHREHRRMTNGLGYHFVIGNGRGMPDGEIAVGPRWTGQLNGGHLASEAQNRYSIGICLVGNFDQTRPTGRQMESLHALVRYLQRRCNIRTSNVTTHARINVRPTRCPGENFPLESFLSNL